MILFTRLLLGLILSPICMANNAVTGPAEDSLENTYGRIIFATALFRHGQRTPKTSYPNDPYPKTIWTEGVAELTKRGKQQAYDLGKWFRKHYESLVPVAGYRYNILKMNSSDWDRTLMSAELVLAGMFPPNENDTWNSDGLRWQPIPVHMKPEGMDNTIAVEKDYCPRIQREETFISDTPDFQRFVEKYKDVIMYTAEKAGFQGNTDDFVAVFKFVKDVSDILTVEDSFNLTLPSWTKKVFPQPTQSIIGQYYTNVSFNSEILKLKAGPLLSSIVSDLQQKRANLTELLFHFYSGHDTTIVALLNLLKVYNSISPPLSSAVLFELREKDGEHNIAVLYRNTTEEPPYILQVPGCGEICSLNRFLEVTKDLIPENWEEECQLSFFEQLFSTHIDSVRIIEYIVAVVIFASLLISICTILVLKKRCFSGYNVI